MHYLLITTLEAMSVKDKSGWGTVNRPINTVTTSFMTPEAREEAVKRIDEYNFKRQTEDMAPMIGHISFLYVRL